MSGKYPTCTPRRTWDDVLLAQRLHQRRLDGYAKNRKPRLSLRPNRIAAARTAGVLVHCHTTPMPVIADTSKVLLVLALASCGSSKKARDASVPDGGRDQQGAGDLWDAGVKPDLSTRDGISADDGPAVLPALCNGAGSLALWVLVEPNNSRELPGSAVRVENGAPFFVLDGTCSVWTNGGWTSDQLGRDREVRRGHLTASDAKALDDELSVQDYTVLADCMPKAGVFDVSVRAIRRGQHYARCPSSGVRFDRAWSVVASLAQSVWTAGSPVDGPTHVSAVISNDAPPDS